MEKPVFCNLRARPVKNNLNSSAIVHEVKSVRLIPDSISLFSEGTISLSEKCSQELKIITDHDRQFVRATFYLWQFHCEKWLFLNVDKSIWDKIAFFNP